MVASEGAAVRALLRDARLPALPAADDGGEDDAALLHNSVYDELSWRMITGRITPGMMLRIKKAAIAVTVISAR